VDFPGSQIIEQPDGNKQVSLSRFRRRPHDSVNAVELISMVARLKINGVTPKSKCDVLTVWVARDLCANVFGGCSKRNQHCPLRLNRMKSLFELHWLSSKINDDSRI
jgi:hypothetical protein